MADLKTLHSLCDNFYKPHDSTGTVSVKSVLANDVLTVKYTTVVYFATERALQDQVRQANEQALQIIDSRIAELKSLYREKVSETLSLEDLGGGDNIELISMAPTTPRKVAYYRYNRTYKVE
jgi:hypothetical protein